MDKIKLLFSLFLFLCIAQLCYAEVDTTKAVIHHTAGSKESDRDLTVKEIDRYHKARGWDGIGYHYLIRKDGTICDGRPLWKHGAHAKGRNHYIGIALTGYDIFTKEQTDSLVTLLNRLGVKEIEPHHEKCPGKGLDLNDIRSRLKEAK